MPKLPKINIDANLKAWIIATLLDAGKDLGIIGVQETGLALQQWAEERKTPDGWTRFEYLTYLSGRLVHIRRQQIGNVATDRAADFAIDWLYAEIEEEIAEELAKQNPGG